MACPTDKRSLCKEIKWLMAIAAAVFAVGFIPALYGLTILSDMRADIRWLKMALSPLAPVVAKAKALPVLPVLPDGFLPPLGDAGPLPYDEPEPDSVDWRTMQQKPN